MCIYVYSYFIWLDRGGEAPAGSLSDAACLKRPRLYCAFRRVKGHRNLRHYSPLSKKSCVRQVVLDKWFPPMLYACIALGLCTATIGVNNML